MNNNHNAMAYALASLVSDWNRQDHELAAVRAGLDPADRINERAENDRIYARRTKQVRRTMAVYFPDYVSSK